MGWFLWSTKHRIERITSTEQRVVAKRFVDSNHSYIKWSDRPSRKLYWMLFEDSQIVGVWGLASAFGWPADVKEFMKKNSISFNELGNNIVYCLSGHEDRNAGTKFLKLLRRDAKVWWKERYGDELKALQCFVLPPRSGAMYKADNWSMIGVTAGKSLVMRTLYGKDREGVKGVEVRTFKSGEVKYLLREFVESPKKLIFVRLL